ncbi:MOSC domain-containing protein [Bradyrhizobium prioriisuperbiae]|uniref:MOSC domain-containing protein n=1 Tax=Bradyrhizobium prioriisuperbiae TaxID=2854389 RepID=UPI0028F131DC|nr:MOSC domain-containing protein [Bradyrhizobium prioritasuperba]
MTDTGTLEKIYRYPVKGLSPEPMARTTLQAGQTLPADRRYAIENGPSGFTPATPQYFPKIKFLMLMRNERLASLETRYDEASHVLTICHHKEEVARGNLETDDGRAAIEAFFATTFAKDLRGPPKVLFAPGHSFSDVPRKVVSIINLASVADLETMIGQSVHPLRFRGNLYVAGWPAWHEFTLLEQTLAIGETRLKVIKRIVRCAAVNVDPLTALRDLSLPHDMLRHYGHDDCGVYAEVIADGEIAAGDRISIVNSDPSA